MVCAVEPDCERPHIVDVMCLSNLRVSHLPHSTRVVGVPGARVERAIRSNRKIVNEVVSALALLGLDLYSPDHASSVLEDAGRDGDLFFRGDLFGLECDAGHAHARIHSSRDSYGSLFS
jgi:hypothetical protein